MADREMLYVFCYDISRDKLRTRVADLFDGALVRVQKSVYEGRMTEPAARRLGDQARILMEPDDSLRIYAISHAGLGRSIVYGPQPFPEASDFYLV